MSVPNQTPLTAHVGNGVTTTFAYQFMLLEAADAVATIDGVEIAPSQYTVAGVGNQSGGSVTFLTAPPSLSRVVLRRDVGLARLTDYQYEGDFQASTVNRDFDRLWMALQDYAQSVSTALRLPPDDGSNPILPPVANRAMMILGFDAAGELTLVPVSDGNANALTLLLASNALYTHGAGMIGYKPGTYPAGTVGSIFNFLAARTLADTLGKFFATGSTEPTMLLDDATVAPLLSMTRKHSGVTQSVVDFGANNGSGEHQAISAVIPGNIDGDAVFAHKEGGIGYPVHGVNSSPNGSGGGFAADSETGASAGVVGNRYNGGAGNGVGGTRLGAGSGSGVAGDKQGSGAGNGVYGLNSGTGSGAGVLGFRQSTGGGAGVQALRQGSGAGDGVLAEHSGTGAGHGVTAIRSYSAVTMSVGYLAYYDIGTGESIGVYGSSAAGGIQWAGRFDGRIRVSQMAVLGGGAEPLTDNTATIGNASKRFNAIWAATGTINTSDRNAKKDVRPLDDAERAVGRRLRELVRVFRFNDGNRLHAGLIAQDVAQAFVDEGLDPAEYAMWCEDEIFDEKRQAVGTEMVDVIGEDGETTQAERTIYQVTKTSLGKRQGLRYDQVLAFIVSVAL